MQSDQRLSALYKRGVDPAFDELVERYRASLTAFAAAIVGSARAEDVVQDSLVKAHRAMAAEEVEEPRAWLYRVVRNTALNEIRDGKKHEHAELSDFEPAGLTPEREVESQEDFKALLTALAALPEAQRQAIVDRELGGYTHEEIARELEVSTGATKQLIFRARNGLRNALGALIPAPMIIWLAQEMAGAFATASSAGAVAGATATAGAGATGGVAAGAGGILGGLAGGGAAKIAAVAVVATGTVAAGVAVEERVVGGGSDSPAAIEETPVEPSGGIVFREDGTPILIPSADSEAGREGSGADRLGMTDRSEVALEAGRAEDGPGAGPGEAVVPGRGPDRPDGAIGASGGPDRPSGGPGGSNVPTGGPDRPGGGAGGPAAGRPIKPGGAGSPAGGQGGSGSSGGPGGGRPSGGSGGSGGPGGSGGSSGSGSPGGGRPSGGSGGSGGGRPSGGSGGSGGPGGSGGGGRPSGSGNSGNSPATGGSPGGSGAKPGGGRP